MSQSVWQRVGPSLALAAIPLLAIALVLRACLFCEDICFLVQCAPANWIIYPLPATGDIRAGVPLDAIFRRSFSLDSVPSTAQLRIRAFRSCTIQLNGKAVALESDPDHWKAESRGDVAHLLRKGRNDLAVTVTNTLGPPALWLVISCSGTLLVSDTSWEVSLAGATSLPAALGG